MSMTLQLLSAAVSVMVAAIGYLEFFKRLEKKR
jgi:hypothetical protein